jgi:hypothetical protein
MPLKPSEIEKLVRHLRAVLEVLEKEIAPVEIPSAVLAEMQVKIDRGECLAWEHQISDDDRGRRGLCETDYQTTMAKIRRGEESEIDLMRRGLLAPKGKSGRKSAREIAEAHKKAEAEMERQRTLKAVKAAEKKAEYKKPKGSSNE